MKKGLGFIWEKTNIWFYPNNVFVNSYMNKERWLVLEKAHPFWTSPYDFGEMKRMAPDLYATLEETSSFVLIKGGLNLRFNFYSNNYPKSCHGNSHSDGRLTWSEMIFEIYKWFNSVILILIYFRQFYKTRNIFFCVIKLYLKA